jgi:hypothetical protein
MVMPASKPKDDQADITTVPPPPGNADAYSAETIVGKVPDEVFALLRDRGGYASTPRPTAIAAPAPAPPAPTPRSAPPPPPIAALQGAPAPHHPPTRLLFFLAAAALLTLSWATCASLP